MDKLQLLKSGIDFAKKNPDSNQAVELRKRIESGMYARELGQLKEQSNVAYVAPKNDNILEKIGNFTGGTKIAQGLAQTIANKTIEKDLGETKRLQDESQSKIIEQMRINKEQGKDNTNLIKALQSLQKDQNDLAQGTGKLLNQDDLTAKKVIGDGLQLGTTIIGAGSLPGVAKKTVGATGIVKGAIQGAKTGAIAGGAFGASSGVASALKEDKNALDIAKGGALGGVGGVVTGGILGGIIGGVSGGLKGRALRKAVLEGQIQSGEKTAQNFMGLKGEEGQIRKQTIKIAKQQGFDDTDIQFINSMKDVDKGKAQQMISLAEKASAPNGKRVLERPIDIVGDSMTDRIKFIQKQNSTFGKAVDTTARELKGQLVDATPLKQRAESLLENVGVFVNEDGTPNWSKSVFKKTPELQKKIMQAFSDIPEGQIDAYDLHNFKKSIDEVVNYGVGGEGLKGKSASILKAVRTSADEILDSNFDAYNQANTDYKATRDVLDMANDLFGKKAGIVKERGGQLLRSVFSNNTQRPRVMALVEQLDKTAQNYGGGFEDNLLDQALFTEILEDLYGTQATTSLQGQVKRAVGTAQKVVSGIRNPIKGGLELAATAAEKSLGISEENKKKILKSLLGL